MDEIVLERFLVVTLIGCYYVSKNPKPNVATNQLRQYIYKNLCRATHFYPFIVSFMYISVDFFLFLFYTVTVQYIFLECF